MNVAFLLLTSCVAGADPAPAPAAPAAPAPVKSVAPAPGTCCGGNCGSGNSCCNDCNPCCEKEGCLAKLKKHFHKNKCCDDCCAPTCPTCCVSAPACAPCANPCCDPCACCEKEGCLAKLKKHFHKNKCCEPVCCEPVCNTCNTCNSGCNSGKCCGQASVAAACNVCCDPCCCAKESCLAKLKKHFHKKNCCCDTCCNDCGGGSIAPTPAPIKAEPIAPPKEGKKMPEGAAIAPPAPLAPQIPAANPTAAPAEVPF